MQIKISFLSRIYSDDSSLEPHGSGRLVDGRYIPLRPTKEIDPVLIDLDVPPKIAEVHVGWGDRVGRDATPHIYGKFSNGVGFQYDPENSHPLNSTHPDVTSIHAVVANAWTRAVKNRSEVAAAVESYRAFLDGLEQERVQKQRMVDLDAIAKAFHRKSVRVGEQTVPGKCVVRSSRGNMLGYANFWNGKWQGTIERI